MSFLRLSVSSFHFFNVVELVGIVVVEPDRCFIDVVQLYQEAFFLCILKRIIAIELVDHFRHRGELSDDRIIRVEFFGSLCDDLRFVELMFVDKPVEFVDQHSDLFALFQLHFLFAVDVAARFIVLFH